jgi:D-glycero-D-manno-heptose 1,7-bisphosphate phosphatase
MDTQQPAVFLDRDGVIIEDIHLLTQRSEIRLYDDAPGAIRVLRQAGFKVIVVSNQPVVARGLATEVEVREINEAIQTLLMQAGGSPVDAFYFCPHHPNATLPDYRVVCDCRKPRPGLILQAAHEHNLHLPASYMIGDRLTDILAGQAAGCRTILIQTGMHTAQPIETSEPIDLSAQPDFICANLGQAATYILELIE